MGRKKNIAVIFGGRSPEHDVSVKSGRTVCSYMDKALFSPVPVYADRKGVWHFADLKRFSGEGRIKLEGEVSASPGRPFLVNKRNGKRVRIDAAFPIIHGESGEDGKLQGFLDTLGINYAGAGLYSSAVCMNKAAAKRAAAGLKIPVLGHIVLKRGERIPGKLPFPFPVFVKPVSSGSSVGVYKAGNGSELKERFKKALKFSDEVMIEKGLDRAREIVCGVLDDGVSLRVSVCGMVRPAGEFFDYESKYLAKDGFSLEIPAGISRHVSERIRKMSLNLFRAVSASGFARIDFLMDPSRDERFYFCEINTLPGFTPHSLYPALWEKSGVTIGELITLLLGKALGHT